MARVKCCVLKQACSSPSCRLNEEKTTILKSRIRDARARIKKTRHSIAKKALLIPCSLHFAPNRLIFSEERPLYCDHVKLVEPRIIKPLYIAVSDLDKDHVEWVALQVKEFMPHLRVFVGLFDETGSCCGSNGASSHVQRKRRDEGFANYKECMAVFGSEEEAKRQFAECGTHVFTAVSP